jgi:group I intron endonuclease
MIGIYKITSLEDCSFYIGSSINISSRWKRHISQLKNKNHSNYYLQQKYQKYGLENLNFEIIEFCDKIKIKEREQWYLDNLKPILNINKIASGGDMISNHPLKDFLKQKQIDGTRKAAKSAALREKRRKNGKLLYPNGLIKNHSEESKKKIRKALGFKIKINDHIFDSVREAAIKMNTYHTCILYRCRSENFPNYQFYDQSSSST